MRVLLCHYSPSSPPPNHHKTPFSSNTLTLDWPQKSLIRALGGALSFGLLISSPSSVALDSSSSIQSQLHPLAPNSSTEYCREERGELLETASESVTNEGIVEEAWDIVNDSFLDAGRRRWSPQIWLVMYYLPKLTPRMSGI